MTTETRDPIEVLCAYLHDKALPVYFRWNARRYKVDKINFVHSVRRGRDKLYFYSVSQGENYFKLCFDTGRNSWQMAEFSGA
jgi:hypothetical protein